MKHRFLGIAIILILIIIATAFFQFFSLETNDKAYVGVTFCGNTTQQAFQLIDKVQNYTNLFILQSGPISKNHTATTQICDYAVNADLNIIVYFGWFDTNYTWQIPWLDTAKQQYGNKLLGIYYYDEPGGIQIDYDWPHYFDWLRYYYENTSIYQAHTQILELFKNGTLPKNYTQASKVYVKALKTDSGLQELKNRKIPAITSEYALPWFDYLGGYDIILSQIGWNISSTQNIALTRGAAKIQEKFWGIMITWTYNTPPYLSSGEEIYVEMIDAYKSGAKIISIFNYPQIENNPYGILEEEHFQALERFWNNYILQKNEEWNSIKAQTAFVLPKDYGWGMRSTSDRIWYWNSDEQTQQIWSALQELLEEYGLNLDIVYDDPDFPIGNQYQEIFYWNMTTK